MSPSNKIKSIEVRGFRSFKNVFIQDMPNAMALVGPNGAGKSNLFRFLEMLSAMTDRKLAEFTARNGGANDQLFSGFNDQPVKGSPTSAIKTSITMLAEPGAARCEYSFTAKRTEADSFLFEYESLKFTEHANHKTDVVVLDGSAGKPEPDLTIAAQSGDYPSARRPLAKALVQLLRGCAVYRFHDTDRLKTLQDTRGPARLLPHGENLAGILYQLKQHTPERYNRIGDQIRRVVPGFRRFILNPEYGKALLRWQADGSDRAISAHMTSDGSLRLFALITLLNMPPEMLPDLILLDEPELGCHPAALELIAGMLQSVSQQNQIILATQSPLLLNGFDLNQVYVAELKDGATEITRAADRAAKHWSEEMRPSDLWLSNIIGGRP